MGTFLCKEKETVLKRSVIKIKPLCPEISNLGVFYIMDIDV